MKPSNMCITHMGKSGLELLRVYPDSLPQSALDEIVLKSMPLSAKDGDFLSSTVQGCNLESYIFSVPGEERNNIVSLVAVYEQTNYNRDFIRKLFTFLITELKRNNLGTTEMLIKILPNLFEGISKDKGTIKISSIITLEFEYEKDKDTGKDPGKKFVESLQKDLWK